MTTNYGLDDGNGNAITTGLPEHTARKTAQRMADERGETLYLYALDGGNGEPGESEAIEASTVRCECGSITTVRCSWVGAKSDTVTVEHMPEQHRASHEAAGNRGVYPHNGAVRLQLSPECAESLCDGDWTTQVEA